ncbi:TolC family protein [Perlabentimonas gracilis]|uniref:TolC family protein n=1 Tax=Perlabentimonas gracilis TaxID=2715279 RepID=UPI00140DCC18|nr:TolC family protein [Perlabentimonas gracilis]NHB67346.1 TolC family protein [Perlabentimonas gracilis]
MKTTKIIILTTALLAIILQGIAQEGWKLEDCISHALQNNIQIKRSELQEKVAQKQFTQSTFQLGPNLSGFLNHQYLNGSTFSQYELEFVRMENQGGSLGISSEITLFNGLYGLNNRARLKYVLESQKQNTEVLKNNVTLNVVASFLQVLLDTENTKLASEQLKLAQQQLTKAEVELELGIIAQGEYLNLKAQHVNQQALVTNANNRLRYSTIELAQLLELENPDEFSIEITPIIISDDPKELDNKHTYIQIAEVRPEIKRERFNVKSAEKQVNMAYGLLSPRISLGYSFGSGYDQSAWYGPHENRIAYPDYTYGQQIKDYSQHVLQFRVSVPIFQRLSNLTQVNQSKIHLLDAKFALEEAQKAVYKDVQSAIADARAAWDGYIAYSEAVKSYQELYKQTVNRFELGMVNALDVGVAQNNLIQAEGQLLHAKYTYILRMKILDFYRGVPIAL